MTRTRLTLRALSGIAVTVAAVAAPLTASPASAVTWGGCGETTPNQGVSYTATPPKTLPNGKMTPWSGAFKLYFALDAPGCRGSKYSITVISADGSSLKWSTVSAQTFAYDATTNTYLVDSVASALTTTSTSKDGLTATVTFTGDGLAQKFSLDGATSGYTNNCVNSRGDITNPDGTSETTATAEVPIAQVCSGGAPATTYWH